MKMHMVVLALLVVGVAFADVGPPSEPPEITVRLVSNGSAYAGLCEVAYECDVPALADGAQSMGEREMEFECIGGVCKNARWFYKLNPCFYPSHGHFEYMVGSKDGYGTTAQMAFDEAAAYDVEIDIDSGRVTKTTTRPSACPPIGIISLAVMGFGMFACSRLAK